MVERGIQVYVLCESGDYVAKIQSWGAVHIPVSMSRFMDPLHDLDYLWTLIKIFHQYRFDFIHTFTVKPNVYGSIAARLAGIKRIYALVEGLGFGYPEGPGFKLWLSRQIFLLSYRIACTLSTRYWFINHDDRALFLEKHLLPEPKAVFIRSVGVDLEQYSPEAVNEITLDVLRQELGAQYDAIYVTLVARMIWDKGVKEFVEAAALLHSNYPNARFLLVGEIQAGSPSTVPEEYLRNLPPNCMWLDFRSDVPALLAFSDIVVLPSYYREGVPRSLLEAMAMGKPLITTDYPGCREIVKDGYNGFLVPIKNSLALSQAIARLLRDADLRFEFGRAGREWVERELDERIVVSRVIHNLYGFT